MKYILILVALFSSLIPAQAAAESDSSQIELVQVYPEPFHEILTFEFKVYDDQIHPVKIKIMNTLDELVFFQSVLIYKNHEKITVNTEDFFDIGLYSIKLDLGRKYEVIKKYKRY
ncbi:MAG: hypothetical protein IPP77_13060 [Bacteroidetes bacterium]|nr:hypothetical protein [Bacteroidota bacterium]